ncbi:MAG: hypothetical protein IJF16_11555, partial [Clostridia bacterium]|nr:hypothetical protein [Clostridia bacterium]
LRSFLVKGFTLPQAPSDQRIASSGLRGLGEEELNAFAYALPVKGGQRVIAFWGGYAIEI